MNSLNESLIYKNQKEFDSIFRKISIYQNRVSHYSMHEAYASYNYDIMFTLNEQEAIQDMFSILESEMLNELSFKSIKDKASELKNNTLDKLNDLKEFFLKIKNGVITKVSELIKAFLELFSKLGDKVSEILTKLKMDSEECYKYLEGYVKAKINDPELKNTNVFESICSINLNSLNEEELNELDKEKWRSSKALQAVFGYKYPGGLSVWKTLIISILGSIVVTALVPMMVAGLGAPAAAVTIVTIACKVLWVGRGTCKVLLQHWVNKEDNDKFFDFKTVFQLLLVVGIPAIFSIPAVKDGLINMIKEAGEKLGIDKWVDKAEDWFNEMVQKYTGKNLSHVSVTERMEEVNKDFSEVGSPIGDGGVDKLYAGADVAYDGKHAEGYISKFIDKLSGKFDTMKDQLPKAKEWFDNIANAGYKSSIAMDNALAGSYHGDNLMFIVDSNRIGSLMTQPQFVNRVAELLQEKGLEGTFVNAISDQLHNATHAAAGTAEILMCDCAATQENIDIVKQVIEEAVGKSGAEGKIADTFCKLANAAVVPGSKIEKVIDYTLDHIWFKTAAEAFTPTYMPIFSKDINGKFKVRLGSNTTGNRTFLVTDVQEMSYKDLVNGKGLSAGLNDMIAKENKIRKKKAEDIKKEIEEYKENNDGKNPEKKEKIQRQIKLFNENSEIQKKKVLVFYTDYYYYKSEQDKQNKKTSVYKHEPLFMLNPNTLQGMDIAIHYRKRRTNPYYIKGLFSRLEFLESKDKSGNSTGWSKEEIANKLNSTIATFIRLCADNVGMNTICDKDGGKYVPIDPSQEKRKDIGNFTNEELCRIFNKQDVPYKYLSGEYADDSLISGNLKHDYIEQQQDEKGNNYIESKIKPWMKDKNGNIYKQINANNELKIYLIDEKGEIKDEVINVIAPMLYRTNTTYLGEQEKKSLIDKIANLFKKQDGSEKTEEEKQYDRKLVSQLVDIIWKDYLNKRAKAKVQQQSTSEAYTKYFINHLRFNQILNENYQGLKKLI